MFFSRGAGISVGLKRNILLSQNVWDSTFIVRNRCNIWLKFHIGICWMPNLPLNTSAMRVRAGQDTFVFVGPSPWLAVEFIVDRMCGVYNPNFSQGKLSFNTIARIYIWQDTRPRGSYVELPLVFVKVATSANNTFDLTLSSICTDFFFTNGY